MYLLQHVRPPPVRCREAAGGIGKGAPWRKVDRFGANWVLRWS